MKRIALLIISSFIMLFTTSTFAQKKISKRPFLNSVGLGLSFNAVADEAVLGARISASKHIFEKKFGTFYSGLAMYYGVFPNTNNDINEYLKGKSSLWQPLQALAGHRLTYFRDRLHIITEINIGPSLYSQKIKTEDNRYQIEETYKYSKFFFTAHFRTGAAIRIGTKHIIGFYLNIPVIKSKIAPYGFGVGVNRMFLPK